MVLLGKIDNGNISIEEDSGTVITVDYSGRLIFFLNDGNTYRRSLDNKFLKISWKDNKRNLNFLGNDEAEEVAEKAYSFLNRSLKKIDNEDIKKFSDTFPELNFEFLKSDSA
ncbi:MAG: hypothetical protein ACP5UV_07565, partial [Thermoplasmata archaeon]